MKKIDITSLEQLKNFAQSFLDEGMKGQVIGLSGDLGAGKTTFVRTFIELLAHENGTKPPRVTSPTYVIQTRYPQLTPCIEHFDLYRLENATRKSLLEIGYFEALEYVRENEGLLFVEWPEKASDAEVLELGEVWRFSLENESRWIIRG